MAKYKYIQANPGFQVVYPVYDEIGQAIDFGGYPVIAWAIDDGGHPKPITVEGLDIFLDAVIRLPNGIFYSSHAPDMKTLPDLLDWWNKTAQGRAKEQLQESESEGVSGC